MTDQGAGSGGSQPTGGAVSFPKKKNRGNIRKRAKPDFYDSPDDAGAGNPQDETPPVLRKAKQRKTFEFTTRAEGRMDIGLEHKGNRAIHQHGDTGATRVLETETEFDRDARAQREKVLKQGEEANDTLDDGKYRGLNSYIDYRRGLRKESTVAQEKTGGAHGPLRANVYIRSSVRIDYQPDLCKDYKETGFCSYGDSCKFLHDRGDYKSGWELEREYEEKRKQALSKAMAGALGESQEEDGDEDSDDELPFACLNCRRPWAECPTPLITSCKHYFCEGCALRRGSKLLKCPVCGESTRGIFNVAQDIIQRGKKGKASKT